MNFGVIFLPGVKKGQVSSFVGGDVVAIPKGSKHLAAAKAFIAGAHRRGPARGARRWSAGDVVTLHLPMAPERLYAHPNVRMDVGRVALHRGPLVYCVEETDNPGGPVQALTLPRSAPLSAHPADALGGAAVLEAPAKRLVSGSGDALYSSEAPGSRNVTLTAVPYYLWANREPGSMQVWIAEAAGEG